MDRDPYTSNEDATAAEQMQGLIVTMSGQAGKHQISIDHETEITDASGNTVKMKAKVRPDSLMADMPGESEEKKGWFGK